jgi:hypothetical protein
MKQTKPFRGLLETRQRHLPAGVFAEMFRKDGFVTVLQEGGCARIPNQRTGY